MRFNFKKISAIATSVLLTGMTLGVAAAANYPAPFVSGSASDVAIVYGTGAGVSQLDQVQASSILADLNDELPKGTVTATGGASVTEDEVTLGGSIVSGDIEATITESDLSTLIDGKLSWDDGDGSEDYDVHEEIVIGTMDILTTLDDEDLDGIAMSNDKALEYRYVFEEALNVTRIGDDDADALYLDILGQSYEVTDMDNTSITVNVAEEHALKTGESVVFDGKTFTVDNIFEGDVVVNAEFIGEGNTKKIDGVRINVDTIGYNSNNPDLSVAILKIGDDISKTYNDGDEYIGEDEDDPLWVWTISNAATDDGYIGVKYNVKIDDADDDIAGDSIKYVGDSYLFPENFGVVTLEGLTDVTYDEVNVYFDEADLFNTTVESSTPTVEDAKVLIIEAPSNSMTAGDQDDLEKIAIYYTTNATQSEGADVANGTIEVFFYDNEGEYTPSSKWRYATQVNASASGTVGQAEVAYIELGDTTLDIDVVVDSGDMSLIFEDTDSVGGEIALNVSGDVISSAAGTLEQLGATLEDADANDVVVNGTDVSTKDNDVMNYYGIVVEDVENNADSDEVTLSVPDDQVYATVSVTAGGEVSSSGATLGNVVIMDSEVSSMSNKNLIVVGGSCINSVAANMLGGSYCGPAFTSATGVGSGQFLIKSMASPYNSAKVAVLVAGYEAANTQAAATYLMNQPVDTSAGNMYKGTSSTSAELIVE